MLRRRTAHLARCFQLVALSMGTPGVWLACTTAASEKPDAAPDASLSGGADALASDEAAEALDGNIALSDAEDAQEAAHDGSAGAEAGLSCWAIVTASDAAGDAEEVCRYVLPCGLASDGLTTFGATCQITPALSDGAASDPDAVGFPYCTLVEGQGCADGSVTALDGGVVFQCIGCPGGGGRRPAGLVRLRAPRAGTSLGAYFAELAQLEAASVRAFETLASELARHRAPRALIRAARKSARDEVRHAASMTRLAERFGARPRAPDIRSMRRRSLAAMARENAVEGCVRETFGAMLNAWQASKATDPEVRAVMTKIAKDELSHAALSWEVAEWAERRLPRAARSAVARAQKRAVARLTRASNPTPPKSLRTIAGLPDAAQSREMARELFQTLIEISP